MAERAEPADEARWPATDEPTPDLAEEEPPPPDDPEPLSLRRRIDPYVELVLLVALAFGIAWGIQAFVLKPFAIPSESMEDTLKTGDRILAARFWYRLNDVSRGDVIVFHPPLRPEDEESVELPAVAGDVDASDGSVTFIKRVIGLPGERISITDGKVHINGRQLDEPYVNGLESIYSVCGAGEVSGIDTEQGFTIPAGHVFVMGDNRTDSHDSRCFGPIDEDLIVGRAFLIIWPPSKMGGL